MNLGYQVSEDYMVLAFLRGELESPRWRQHVQLGVAFNRYPRSLITDPNLTDAAENAARTSVLAYRGYNYRTGLFEGFPDDVVWRLAMCDPHPLLLLRHPPDTDFDPGDTEIIVVGTSTEDLMVLEGNARVVAARKQGLRKLPAVVGLSPNMPQWKYWAWGSPRAAPDTPSPTDAGD